MNEPAKFDKTNGIDPTLISIESHSRFLEV